MKTLFFTLVGGILFFSMQDFTHFKKNIETKAVTGYEVDTLKKDTETGLYLDENLYMVKAQCTNCHSSKVIMQHRYSRETWVEKIRWMQANHNLWNLGETEVVVLDYLEKYYGPETVVARRKPLTDIKWYKLEK